MGKWLVWLSYTVHIKLVQCFFFTYSLIYLNKEALALLSYSIFEQVDKLGHL